MSSSVEKQIRGIVSSIKVLEKKIDLTEFVSMTVKVGQEPDIDIYGIALPLEAKERFQIGEWVQAEGSVTVYDKFRSLYNMSTSTRYIHKISKEEAQSNEPIKRLTVKALPNDMMSFEEGYYYLEEEDQTVYFNKDGFGLVQHPMYKEYPITIKAPDIVKKTNYRGKTLGIIIKKDGKEIPF